MRETKIPYSVVKDLIDTQNKYNEAQLRLLGEYLERCAVQYEKALNPPIRTPDPNELAQDQIMAHPRMSEDEEDLRHAYRMGDIDEVEFQRRLDMELGGSFIDD